MLRVHWPFTFRCMSCISNVYIIQLCLSLASCIATCINHAYLYNVKDFVVMIYFSWLALASDLLHISQRSFSRHLSRPDPVALNWIGCIAKAQQRGSSIIFS